MKLTTQSGNVEGVAPRPAATVVLLRESEHGTQVLLTIRPKHLVFMGGAAVFPGGAVDEGDLDPGWESASTLSPAGAAEALGVSDEASALGSYVCAVREGFEEVGWIPGSDALQRITRTDAATGETFLRSCLEAGAIIETDQLIYAGRWITPVGSPRRFDTRFFLCRVEPDWEPSPAEHEVEACMWMTATEALAELAAGELLMAPPTIEMLQRLEPHDDAQDMIRAVVARGLTGAGSVVSTRISPLVHVVLAPNPGLLTGPGTNTYVVGTGPTLVIDPAVDDAAYLEAVLEAARDVAAILVTHRHPDHVGGAASLAARTGADVRAFGSAAAGDAPVRPLADGDVIEVPGASLTSFYTPGHARDHLCFYLSASASLFSGDNILGEGTAVIAPPEGDMRAYLDSLRGLNELNVDRIYPGHFRPLDDGNEAIRRYLSHRHEREQAILGVLAEGPASAEEITRHVYTDTPESLLPVARYSVIAHLEMAEAEGRVTRDTEKWRLSAES